MSNDFLILWKKLITIGNFLQISKIQVITGIVLDLKCQKQNQQD